MSSESVIRDADMAEEMTKFTRNQIMVQSSTAMLAQANARSQSVLSLLG
jgi:flagellin